MKCPYAWIPWIAFSPAVTLAAEPQADEAAESSAASADEPATAPPSTEPPPADAQVQDPSEVPQDEVTPELSAPTATEEPILTLTPSSPASKPEQATAPPEATADLSAPDTLAGHLRLALNGQASFPAGNIAQNLHTTRSLSTNFIAGLDLAFGISRHLTLGVTGDYQVGYSTTECPSCSTTGFGTGLLLRHHLTQGLRFDPWLAFGLGIRSLGIQSSEGNSNYVSLEWLRLQVGGDFFVAPPLGLGPVIDFALSTSVKTDEREDPGSVGVRFGLGLRAVFDLPGRGH